MTITVTLEELRKFESDYSAWCERRSMAAISVLTDSKNFVYSPINFSADMSSMGKKVKAFLDEWDKNNPEPKLIPSV